MTSTTVRPIAVTHGDHCLMTVFTGKRFNSKFQYEIIFQDIHIPTHIDVSNIWANNKKEATKWAIEYGIRFLNCKVVSVSRVAGA